MGKRRPTEIVNTTVNKQLSGLKLTPDKSGFTIDWETVPAIENFFVATDFRVKRDLSSLVMIFGSVSAFENRPERFDQAVEIRFPLNEARTFIYEGAWKALGGNGKTPFSQSLIERNRHFSTAVETYQCQLDLPQNKDISFRKFASNFCTMTFSGGQALIEFFEAPPDLLHYLLRGQTPRPQAGLKIVMGVMIDPVRLLSFLNETRVLLEPLTAEEMGLQEVRL